MDLGIAGKPGAGPNRVVDEGRSAAGEPAPGGDYNRVPYVSHAFPQSEPGRLFGLMRLFGLAPPRVETARVLEIGCASGGNIIPLAVRYPGMRIEGIDLTPRHVADGVARIAALGLANIEIRQGDVTSVELPAGTYDCVICHGVFSWVPPAAQEAILRLAARCLTPDGVAYVSYNVFPGWQMRGMIRDLMLFHAGVEGTAPPEQRIAKARWVLDHLARLAKPNSSYGARLIEEAKNLATVEDAYILGEFLAPINAPCYFREFHAAAERHGLAFLCESEIETCLPETLGPEVAQLVRSMSANQLLPMEQYIDFFMGRQFRQSLLVPAARQSRIVRQLDASCIQDLEAAARLAPDAAPNGETRFVYRTPQGRTVTTTNLAVRAALERIRSAYPSTISVAALISEGRADGTVRDDADAAAVADIFFQMIVGGLLKVSSAPLRVGGSQSARLVASPLARADAAAGRATTTTLRHESWTIDPVCRVLLPFLDGGSGPARLERKLLRAADAGVIQITDDRTAKPLTGDARQRAAAEHVKLALARLSDAALLIGDGGC